jgi:hypothetical protein
MGRVIKLPWKRLSPSPAARTQTPPEAETKATAKVNLSHVRNFAERTAFSRALLRERKDLPGTLLTAPMEYLVAPTYARDGNRDTPLDSPPTGAGVAWDAADAKRHTFPDAPDGPPWASRWAPGFWGACLMAA